MGVRMSEELISKYRGAKLREVLEIKIAEGEGTRESPIREVIYLCNKDGEVITRLDNYKTEEKFYFEESPNTVITNTYKNKRIFRNRFGGGRMSKLKTLKDLSIPDEMKTENPLGYAALERLIYELKQEAILGEENV
jgi:hypothetical protein